MGVLGSATDAVARGLGLENLDPGLRRDVVVRHVPGVKPTSERVVNAALQDIEDVIATGDKRIHADSLALPLYDRAQLLRLYTTPLRQRVDQLVAKWDRDADRGERWRFAIATEAIELAAHAHETFPGAAPPPRWLRELHRAQATATTKPRRPSVHVERRGGALAPPRESLSTGRDVGRKVASGVATLAAVGAGVALTAAVVRGWGERRR